MKKIITILFLLISSLCKAQQPVSWQIKIGGMDTEYANAVDTGLSGTMFAAGFIRSRTGDYIMQYPGPDGLSPDAWIVKYDRYGVIAWQKCFGGSNPDEFFDVKATPDGGAIAVGRSGSTDGNITGNKGGEDIIVVKYDANGNIQWNRNYGSSLLDGARKILLQSDGTYVLGCYSNGNNMDFIGGKGGRDIWLMQISATGNIMRKKNFGGSSDEDVFDMQLMNDGRWIFTGSTGSINGDVTGNHGSTDAWVVKLNADWTMVKQKCFGSTGQDIGNGILPLPDGFMIAARVNANNGDVTGLKGGNDGFIIKTDTALNKIWAKTYGGSSHDYFNAMSFTADGNVLLAGETSSIDGDITANAGLSDAWLLKVDTASNIIWSKTFGNNKADRANTLLIWGNDDYLFAGMNSYTIPNTIVIHPQLWMVTSKILPVQGPLPIHLISFDGLHTNNGNRLTWQSATELNSKKYVVERSMDGIVFAAIGSIAAAGNSSNNKSYTFTDVDPKEKCWYRLRMVDLDGHEAFSKIILIKAEAGKETMKVYPTVTSNLVTIEFTASQHQPHSFSVIDLSGKVISRQIKNATPGINKCFINVADLSAGVYFVVHEYNNVKSTAKFIKE